MAEFTKMEAELKAKWVAALRSGTFRQGNGFMRTGDDKFCCLGVLREIMEPRSDRSGEDFDVLPDDMALLAGLEPLKGNNWQKADGAQAVLARMNDDGKTFAEIADYIEANL